MSTTTDDPHWGFSSWNDFFTRRLRDGARPVASPEDDDVIAAACESTPFALRSDVQRRDRFWLKTQPYSLQDMLADDPAVDEFVGGTVYQAFLSATNYHRWHSPVAGTIERAFVVDGTYYSEPDSPGSGEDDSLHSQAYLAHVATRAVFLIRADNPAIGLVAFVPVGMSRGQLLPYRARHRSRGARSQRPANSATSSSAGPPTASSSGPASSTPSPPLPIPQPHDPHAPLVLARSTSRPPGGPDRPGWWLRGSRRRGGPRR